MKRKNGIAAETIGVLGVMAVIGEGPGSIVKFIQSGFSGPDPEISRFIFYNSGNGITAETVGITGFVPVHVEGVTVEPVQAIPGAEPHEPFGVLVNG